MRKNADFYSRRALDGTPFLCYNETRDIWRAEKTHARKGSLMILKYYLITCGVMSIIAFVLFARDKAASKGNRARIPELTLLTLASLGGGVGAMLGKVLLRHKSNVKRKFHFFVVLTISVVIQAGFLAYLIFMKL